MIAFIRGIIDEITEESVVIDTGSMGYNIRISGKTAGELPGLEKKLSFIPIQVYVRMQSGCMVFLQGMNWLFINSLLR